MPRKPIELPPQIAKDFVRDMQAFFSAGLDLIKADGIAAGTLHSLRQHYSGKLRLTDVKAMFLEMKDWV